jgi:biopolymer transport protein ExbD
MKQSIRAKRMARHHSRLKKMPTLSLVSLMDIFTILVFFLLVNSSDVEVIEADKGITLPVSAADAKPNPALIMKISASDIMIDGQRIASVADFMASKEDKFAAIADELRYQANKAGALTEIEQKNGRRITIMGDQTIPYELLKKVMMHCVNAEFRNISLAVTEQETSAKAGGG